MRFSEINGGSVAGEKLWDFPSTPDRVGRYTTRMKDLARVDQISDESYADRRRNPRLHTDARADIMGSVDQPAERPTGARVLNISKGGVALRTDRDMTVGTRVSLVLYYEGYDSVCLGELIWKKKENGLWVYGICVQRWSFLDPVLEQRLSALEKSSGAGLPPAA
jgi:hypothetical protein